MTFSFEEQLAQAMAAMEEQQAKMAEMARELQVATASATTKDRMVTAKVGAQGEVLALTFHTTAYQEMAPAELAAVLKDVLNEAKARMGERISQSMRSFDGVGETLRLAVTGEREEDPLLSALGGLDLDALLAPLTAMRPGADRARTSHKQDEFNG
ncbi:DNA-binding protein YbaB [Kitasatospora sp. MAA19]|uniref:YbaB/EbfC family nucleoid-associated protein n=1 Tax=unclassified Kitasatospora TaxID=2633591 RepID=UPI0024737E60|nr:YbaB/EbfC family nucleoid-associated protein [Kitasatospora sp. MAA19]MDH6707802.1 DNA-binding protein YbaB [Kitasatospora sp. MAA19]